MPSLPTSAASGQRRPRLLEYHRLQRRANTERTRADYRRLAYALLLSFAMHALLLALTLGGEGRWILAFSFPWQDRRVYAPDLRVVVVPPKVTAAEPPAAPVVGPSQPASVATPVAGASPQPPVVSLPPSPPRKAATSTPGAVATVEGSRRPEVASGATPAQAQLRDASGDATSPRSPTPVIAVDPTADPTWVMPQPRLTPLPDVVAAPSISMKETPTPSLQDPGSAARARIDQEVRERAVELAKLDRSRQEAQRQAEQLEAARHEAARTENARLQSEREEAARRAVELQEKEREVAAQAEATQVEARTEAAKVEAAKLEAARVETARVEAARVEAAKVEAARVEASKIEAARIEAAKVDIARSEAAKAEAARVEAARVETSRSEAAKAEAARAEAARADAARVEAAKAEAARAEAAKAEAARAEAAKAESSRVDVAQDAAARREERLRAIGRQLNDEAAMRDAATAAARPLPSGSSVRRYRLFGRTDPNAEVILYAEAWARKIQLNMTLDMVRDAAKQPHTDPLVTVAIRSDGSVESVTIVKSSGVPALDEAIRRVVYSQTPYEAFTPGMAREMDVIEIRRSWYFDVAIRLY